MAIIEQLNSYMDTIIILSAVLLVMIAAVYIYLFRIRKVTAKEEKVNYNTFRRKDSVDFIKFKNILSESGEKEHAMGIVDLGNHTYVGGIDIVGYNYDAASAEEQQHTIMNAESLANIIDGDVQFRQSVRAVDLGKNIEQFQGYQKNLEMELLNLGEEYNDLVRLIEDVEGSEEQVEYLKSLMEQADEKQKEIAAKQWLIQECKLLLLFMTVRADRDIDAQKVNQLLYTYRFNPSDYTEELTEEEIGLKALQELRTIGISYADAVAACGCRTNLLTADDFVSLLRQHSAPFGADDMSLDDLANSSYQSLFVSSNSLVELELQKRDEEEYKRQMEELAAKRDEIRHMQFTERERNKRETRRYLDRILGSAEGGEA